MFVLLSCCNICHVNKNHLTATEVAKRYEVTPFAVKGWIKRGLLPNAMLEETVAGKIWLIPESDLKDFVPPQMGRPPKAKDKDDK